MTKQLPFDKIQIKEILQKYPSPVYIYDESGIRHTAQKLNQAFSWVEGGGYQNYFAVKATPNPSIMQILKEEGMGADCSSFAELILAEKTGILGNNIMFTSNDTPAYEYQKAMDLQAIINLDDIQYIDYLEKVSSLPKLICFRYNPGNTREGNSIIGKPEEAKYGLTIDQIISAYQIAKQKGIQKFGLHTMVVSNELNETFFIETARMLFELVIQIHQKHGILFDFVNLGGGLGIPYKPEDKPIQLEKVSQGIQQAYQTMIVKNNLHPLKIVTECGRYITGPHGYLITQVRHITQKYRDYVGVDACMANLMRPGMYGAYHHITVLGKENLPQDHIYDVVGSLCENNDKFAIQRNLPLIEEDDILVIHDSGAHGHSMGFQYNGKLRSAEILLKADGSTQQIRRAETLDDYFQTLSFDGSNFF